MFTDQFPQLQFPLPAGDAQRLPRNPAYRYRVFPDHVELVPHPRCGHAILPTASTSTPRPPALPEGYFAEKLGDDHWSELTDLFVDAFSGTLPLSVLPASKCRSITEETLSRTRSGGDGPLIDAASFVLRKSHHAGLVAAIVVTLMPAGNLRDFTDPLWQESPPEDAIGQRWGRPHLTWVLTSPSHVRCGLGRHLLHMAQSELKQLGYPELASTFLLDNVPSLLWHWSCGFQLQSALGE